MNKLERFDDWLWKASIIGPIYRSIFQTFHKIKETPRNIKWFFQEIFRGYSDCDLWSLDYFICKKIIKPLKHFRKSEKHGHPAGLKNMKEWNTILDKMIFSIEEGSKNHCFMPDKYFRKNGKIKERSYRNYLDKVDEGRELFGLYLFNLWD